MTQSPCFRPDLSEVRTGFEPAYNGFATTETPRRIPASFPRLATLSIFERSRSLPNHYHLPLFWRFSGVSQWVKLGTPWISLLKAADHLAESPASLRKKLERAAVLRDGMIEAELPGLRARKFGKLWKVRLSDGWL